LRPDLPVQKIKKIGVLGAGMMGSGIAYASARAGIAVALKDVNQEVFSKLKDKPDLVLTTTKMEDLKDCDLVIEAVIEDRNIKKAVIEELEKYCRQDSIIGSNTSTLPITGLADYSIRPEN